MKLYEMMIPMVFVLAVLAFGACGWITNIYKLTKCDFQTPYKSEIIRGVGIAVPPVGALCGYLNFPDSTSVKQ